MPLDIKPLAAWANERHAIYLRKTFLEGKTPPPQYAPVRQLTEAKTWTLDHLTDDPILNVWRFTNVFRELDRVTIWIRKNIREPFADHPDLWLMLAIARTINWPPTLEILIKTDGAWPSHQGFKPETMSQALNRWQAAGNKVVTAAYMVRAESDPKKHWYSWPKNQYLSEIVLGRLWSDRAKFSRLFDTSPTMHRVWAVLKDYMGWGGFMAGQVTTDLRHTRFLSQASDRASWAAKGPGSQRGLNRLYGRDLKTELDQDRAVREMLAIQSALPLHLAAHVPKDIELTDIQSVCCEVDKHLRAKGGEGKPKVKYVPGRGC